MLSFSEGHIGIMFQSAGVK